MYRVKICAYCGREFHQLKRRTKIYCSRDCCNAARNKRDKEKRFKRKLKLIKASKQAGYSYIPPLWLLEEQIKDGVNVYENKKLKQKIKSIK